jgi:hypothetical protein
MKKLLALLSVTLVLLCGALLVYLLRGSESESESESESDSAAEVSGLVETGEVNKDLVRNAEIGQVIRQTVDVKGIDFGRLAERIQRAHEPEVRQGLIREFQLAAAKADPAKRAELYALLGRLL